VQRSEESQPFVGAVALCFLTSFLWILYICRTYCPFMLFGTAKRNDDAPDLKSLPDDQLIAYYKQSSDRDVIAEIYDRYAYLLYGVCMKYMKNEADSKDALMQVFEKLYDSLKIYEIGYFKSWFYSVTKHHCLFLLKKHKEYAVEEDILMWKTPKEFVEFGDDLTLCGRLEKIDQTKKLEWAMEQLNEEQRICVDLFYLKEKSYEEVQEITKFTYKQVKSFIQNGKRNLKNLLSESHE
jgi:RNA polymerase sigma factor (sigma-70 family)